ncbi:MAG: outer membrane protein assembly factor BamE domain-containing protein [Burkholderiales bacterium]
MALFDGCASYSGRGLKPGLSSEDEVRQVMGVPAATWETPDGPVWAYPRGPLGVETFLVQFDASGVLELIEPVLNEEHIAQIKPDMTQDDVLHRIGPPFQTLTFSNLNEVSWDYRFRDLWGYSSIFSAIFDEAGRVKRTFRQRENIGNSHHM